MHFIVPQFVGSSEAASSLELDIGIDSDDGTTAYGNDLTVLLVEGVFLIERFSPEDYVRDCCFGRII